MIAVAEQTWRQAESNKAMYRRISTPHVVETSLYGRYPFAVGVQQVLGDVIGRPPALYEIL